MNSQDTDFRRWSGDQRIKEWPLHVEAAGASSWGRLKNAVDEGLKELGHAVDEAVGRFRKTGSGDNR